MKIVYIAFLSLLVYFGASLMSLQMVAFRLMSRYFGSGVFVGGSIISMFMIAMAVGYSLGGQVSRWTNELKYLLFGLLGASVWITILPFFYEPVCEAVLDSIGDPRWESLIAMCILYFVPIVGMAMVSPYIIGVLSELRGQTGMSAGIVLSTSTFGSFVGTIGTSFYLILWFNISDIVMYQGLLGIALVAGVFALRVDSHIARLRQEAEAPPMK